MNGGIHEVLGALGFTELESTVYLCLLRMGPSTGYAVARETGRNKGNTYKALESLATKGAALLEDDQTRRWSAVPQADFLGALERRFMERKAQATSLLSDIHGPRTDDRVFRLQSVDAVYDRIRTLLDGATHLVLVDAFPRPLERMAPHICTVASKGVRTAVRTYGEIDLGSARVFRSEDAEIAERWPGQWLAVAVDAKELVLAYLSDDLTTVLQAVWSASAYLALPYSDSMSAELILGSTLRAFEADTSSAAEILKRARQDVREYCSAGTPGQTLLLADQPQSERSGV